MSDTFEATSSPRRIHPSTLPFETPTRFTMSLTRSMLALWTGVEDSIQSGLFGFGQFAFPQYGFELLWVRVRVAIEHREDFVLAFLICVSHSLSTSRWISST